MHKKALFKRFISFSWICLLGKAIKRMQDGNVISEFLSNKHLVYIGPKGEVIDFVCKVELIALLNYFAKCHLISRMG